MSFGTKGFRRPNKTQSSLKLPPLSSKTLGTCNRVSATFVTRDWWTPLPSCLLHCDTLSPLPICQGWRMKKAEMKRSPRSWLEGHIVTERRRRLEGQLPEAASENSTRMMITSCTKDFVAKQLDRFRQPTTLASKELKRSPLHHKNRAMGMRKWIAQRRLRNLLSFFPSSI